MTASESCVDFIKKVEGFSAKPYYDYGQHTVGYGTKCPTEKYFDYLADGIPKEEAEILLKEAIADIEDNINKKLLARYQLSFNQHQFDALVSFTFNLGKGWMSYDSTLRNALLRNAGEDELVYAFCLYSTAGGSYSSGLISRRLCESNMFINGIYSKTVSDAYGYVFYEPNGGSLTYQVQGFVLDTNPSPRDNAVRNGDVFVGWYTDLTGGTEVTRLDRSLAGKTLFARWQSSEQAEPENAPSTVIQVTGDVVNIRKGPGTNYGIAKQVYSQDVLVVSHVTQLSGRKWGKVDSGWICLEYTNYDALINGTDEDNTEVPSNTVPESETVPEQQTSVSGVVKVNDLLRIRSGPGTTYATVGYLTNGRQVEILEQKTSGTMVWGRITRGWVSMDYIRTENPPADPPAVPETAPPQETNPEQEIPQETESGNEIQQETEPSQESVQLPEETIPEAIAPGESTVIHGKIIADALRIRSGPGTENPIAGFYYQNNRVIITEKVSVGSTYWGKTSKGWINMDYVETDSPDAEDPHLSETQTMTIIADCLRVRKSIGTDSRISALLYYGDKVTVSETQTVDGTTWGKVEKGWICMDYVR